MSQQLSHHSTDFARKRFPIVLILDGLHSPANIGSLFRLADAFSIEKIVFCDTAVDLNSSRLKRTARATFNWVVHEYRETSLEACTEYARKGYVLMALEITGNSLPLQTQEFGDIEKIALVIGNENVGVGKEVLDLSQKVLHINMFGKNSSMNVAQATGIALYEITRSLRPFN